MFVRPIGWWQHRSTGFRELPMVDMVLVGVQAFLLVQAERLTMRCARQGYCLVTKKKKIVIDPFGFWGYAHHRFLASPAGRAAPVARRSAPVQVWLK